MALPDEGPCEPWCTWEEATRCTSIDLSSIEDEAVQADLLWQATEALFNLSERAYLGECTNTAVVCRVCSCMQTSCRCRDRGRDIDLGGMWFVGSVEQVVINGTELSPAAYRVDDWRWLVRLDGQSWPTLANLDSANAFQVSYTYGRRVPRGGKRAAAVFVSELALACIGSAACQLPSRYRTITGAQREGLSYTIIDSMKMLEDGKTGLYVVDQWVQFDKLARHNPTPGMVDPAVDGLYLAQPNTGV